MATSGVSAYTSSTLDIVTEALELLGVLGEGESPNTAQMTSMKRTLNNLCKAWQADGLNIFAVQPLFLFPDGDTTNYLLYLGSSAKFTASYNADTLAANSSSGATSVTVNDGSLFTNGGMIGITTPSNVTHWSSISGVAGDTITFTTPLTEDVFTDALVFTYAAQASQPMVVMDMFYRQHTSPDVYYDHPINQISRNEYSSFPQKNAIGAVTNIWVDRQRTATSIIPWPIGNAYHDVIGMYVQRRLDTFINNNDEPDYPQEWFLALTYNLAMASLPKYGNPMTDFNKISSLASVYYEQAKGFDKEIHTTIQIQPRFY